DRFAASRTAVPVGVAQRIDAPTIFLLIKLLALGDLDHARRAAALAPVVRPVDQIRITGCRAFPAAIDLVHVLPARNPQRTGYCVKTVLMGVKRSTLEPHVEADRAAFAPFRFIFKTFDTLEPVVAII